MEQASLDTDLFLRELAKGHKYAEIVADQLRSFGLTVEVTPMEIAETWADVDRFSREEYDLLVEGHRVDVKSRALRWAKPQDFPYEWPMVDTAYGWRMKDRKPCAYILISQFTHATAVVPCSTFPLWRKTRRHDAIRSINDTFYEVPRSELKTLDDFAQWIVSHRTGAA